MIEKPRILWADDEIDMLKPHILFLEEKGYDITAVNNGKDAIDEVVKRHFDIVFLDENMPGINGLAALQKIKEFNPQLPVIMITKSEEESIMEDAIGSKISDYLIKPVNPKQILLAIKKNLEEKQLVSDKNTQDYRQEFREISMRISERLDPSEWADLYRKMSHWAMMLSNSEEGMDEILASQWKDANDQFSKFYKQYYTQWLKPGATGPLMSHTLFKSKVLPLLKETNEQVLMLVIDNLRYDQWRTIQPKFREYFRIESDEIFYSILPTATHYARNALFAGLMPAEIERVHPQLWVGEETEGGKNMHEEALLAAQLKRLGLDLKWSYHKITNLQAGKKLTDQFSNIAGNRLNAVVYNFVDMLSHARTEMEVIKELASDEAAYRSITASWFEHSPLAELVKKAAEAGHTIVVCTDHGTIRVQNPVKVVGDRNTNTNLRYKTGRNLNYNPKEVYEVRNPADIYLPKSGLSSTFIFAESDDFFVYPNNYNQFVHFYENTFQHGGISMEEVMIPVSVMRGK